MKKGTFTQEFEGLLRPDPERIVWAERVKGLGASQIYHSGEKKKKKRQDTKTRDANWAAIFKERKESGQEFWD